MASKNKPPPEGGGKERGELGGQKCSSSKKQKTRDDNSSFSNAAGDTDPYQEIASCLAKKLLEEEWLTADESKLKDILMEEIKQKDITQSGTLQQAFQTDRETCVDGLIKWGIRVYCARLDVYCARLGKDAEWADSTRIETWIKLSRMQETSAKTKFDLNIELALGATMSSHVNPKNHKTPTKIEEAAFELNDIPLLSEVMKGEVPDLSSAVLQRFDPRQLKFRGRATYANEADVSNFVVIAIQDALTYMNALIQHNTPDGCEPIVLDLRTECSMFSNKPDHFVISAEYQKYHFVLPVEVKKDHANVFTACKVAAQVGDYIMLQKMLTGHPSLAVLTSFNHSKVVWDSDCEAEVKNTTRFALLKDTVRSLVTEMAKSTIPVPPPADQNFNSPPATTAQSRKCLTGSPPELVEAPRQEAPGQGENSERVVMYSNQTYSPYKLLSLLCNALVASLNMGLGKIKIHIGNLQEGQTVLVLKGKQENDDKKLKYEWRILDDEVNVGEAFIFKDSQNEYLARTLVGVGSTSRCWGAVAIPDVNNEPKQGFSCVVKYWVKIWDHDTNEYIEANEIATESDAKTRKEIENYETIYGDLFFSEDKGICVGRQKLNNTHCVILPFFKPIGKDERQGEKVQDVLKEVREVLTDRFYKEDEGKSYRFKESDQRWSHIGRWTEQAGPGTQEQTHLVLFDLADLEIKEATKEEHDAYVENHVKTLRQNLPVP